jgi:putative ABC transport system permease protein
MNGVKILAAGFEAISALGANRLRSTLTILGMVIGVSSVILMTGIGQGAKLNIGKSISSLGANQLNIMSGAPSSGGFRGASGSLPTLTIGDAQAIAQLTTISKVAPLISMQAQLIAGAANKGVTVTGSTTDYFSVNSMTLELGQAFTEAEVRSGANVVVLGSTARTELFGPGDPIGQLIRIQRQPFTVIGVLKPKGQGFGGGDQDNVAVMPITSLQRRLSGSPFPGTVSMVLAEPSSLFPKGVAQSEIEGLLRQRHRIAAGAEDDFAVRDLSAVGETLATTMRVLSILLAAIATISLMVGGIGIMNIMLVSVGERTREIGLRQALGANKWDIQTQFLAEAAVLSAIGGIAGILLGVGVSSALRLTGMTVPIDTASVAMALSVAVLTGLIFGWWPARRAAQLAPVQALRQQ